MKHTKKYQSPSLPRLTRLAALMATSSFAAMMAGQAYAQDAKPADAAKEDVVGLDRVVVTATSQAKSKMRSSVSVTDLDQEQIKDAGVRTESEVLLLIPGIRTNPDAGPGGNSNITVRGLPIASGGSKYVQLQEDGLPVVQFGDMIFANNDYWIRFDNNVDSIQSLRGGSASIYASHAPGAVINYISKTGKEQGGSIGLTRGLNYNETRVDGDYGAHLSKDMYYHIGGYYRQGEGVRHAPADSLLGYQLKGNVTKEFNDGKGYFRVNFKLLDEHAPTTPQVFMNATLSGNTIGGFSSLPNYDALRDSQYSVYSSRAQGLDPVTLARTDKSMNGITVKTKSVGLEFHNELNNGFSVDNKFRIAKNSGEFNAQFLDATTLADAIAGVPGGTQAKYVNGPAAGSPVGPSSLVFRGAAINVQMPDIGILSNDLSVNKQFKLGDSTMDVRGGLFFSRQNVAVRWAISERLIGDAPNGALIDVFNGAGTALTAGGLTGYNNQWGGCCARDTNVDFTTTAPYLGVNYATGGWDFDGGLRQEYFSANGTYSGSMAVAPNVFVTDTAHPGLANYSVNYLSYSAGANYRISNDLSVFGRLSKGHRAMSDRLLYSPNIDAATGLLTSGGKSAAVAPVEQAEVGVRYRFKSGSTRFGVAATVFDAKTTEYDYDPTRDDNPASPNYKGPKLNVQGFKSQGLELETSAAVGSFGINFNATYTDEKVASDLVDKFKIGKTTAGVPKWRYTISPRFALGQAVIGATVRGQSEVYFNGDNTIKVGGYFVTSAFANYDFGNGLVGSLNVGNLFNVLHPTGGGDGFQAGIFKGNTETGRSINASIRYSF